MKGTKWKRTWRFARGCGSLEGNRPVGMAGIKKAKTPALIHWTDTCAGPTVFCAVPEALGAQRESPHPAGVWEAQTVCADLGVSLG